MNKIKSLIQTKNFLIQDLKSVEKDINNRIAKIINRISDVCPSCNGTGFVEYNTNWGKQKQKCACLNGRIIRPIWIKILERKK